MASAGACNVLVVGANGYLGSAICRAFLRAGEPASYYFRVFGLVRRAETARPLAAQEVVPVVGSLADRERLRREILSHDLTWHVIVVCTEPTKTDSTAEAQHWDDVLALVRGLAQSSTSASVPDGSRARPLVLWSSGCKDYGKTNLHADPGLAPHVETSPLEPHPFVRVRMEAASRALDVAKDHNAGFDAAVIRATPVFGYSGSYYGAGLEYAAKYADAVGAMDGKNSKHVLQFTSPPGTILHGVHVDDCGDAYVALAKTALFDGCHSQDKVLADTSKGGREGIVGREFNISGRRYETLEELGTALAVEYGFTGGARFGVPANELPSTVDSQSTELVFGYSQWVGSEKIRAVTGWNDRRPLFSENLHAYRVAYEAAVSQGSDDVGRIRRRIAGDWSDNLKSA